MFSWMRFTAARYSASLIGKRLLAAFGLRLRRELHCFALIELAFCLRQRCNKRPRIDLKQHVALSYKHIWRRQDLGCLSSRLQAGKIRTPIASATRPRVK